MGKFNSLETTTIRDFSGGLNVVTDDLNMSTQYSTIETNVFNNINGTKSIRYGTKLFTDIGTGISVDKTVSCTNVSQYRYKFTQPTNKIPVGTKVSVYASSTATTPSLEGIATIVNDQYFYIDSYTTNASFTTNTSVYLVYKILDVEYDDVEVTFKSKTTSTVLLIESEDLPELQYLYIGTKVKLESTNHTLIDIDSVNGYYYFNCSTTLNSVRVRFTYNKISGTRIINGTYFIDKLVLVSNIGEVCTVDGIGKVSIIFNADIDRRINIDTDRTTFGWSNTTSVCFAVFNGILTIWNGRDKPLAVDLSSKIPCNYLLDQGTMSNLYVPRAKYAISFNHYLVAGNVYDDTDINNPKFYTDRLCISAKDSIGTFYSGLSQDVDNDAVNIDLGTIISSNGQNIKGLSRYRNQLVVGFDDVTVFGTLGDYIETEQQQSGTYITIKNHNPKLDDVIDKHGCISNRTFATISSSLLCLDYSGIPSFSRRNIAASVLPNRISELIAPEIYKNYINLTENSIEDRIFGINNPKENQYLLFIPNNDDYGSTTETICYAYTLRSKVSNIFDGAWSKFTGWNFDYGVTSALNTVFLGKGTKIYILGSIDNPLYADYIDDPDYPAINDEDTSGKAISFEWELPWADFGDRAAIKKSRYLALSTTGLANFTVDMFVDYIYTNKETGDLTPSLSMNFVAGDSYGYGNGNNFTIESDTIIPNVTGNQYYGGGRRTNTEFLFAWTTKYKIAKVRISGSSKFKLNINSLTFYYLKGNIRR